MIYKELGLYKQAGHPDVHLILQDLAEVLLCQAKLMSEDELDEYLIFDDEGNTDDYVSLKEQTIFYLNEALAIVNSALPADSIHIKTIQERLNEAKNI